MSEFSRVDHLQRQDSVHLVAQRSSTSTTMTRSNFLAIPPKRTLPLPELPSAIRDYIAAHFRDTHPDAFTRDVDQLAKLRRSWCEGPQGSEVHRQVVTGLLR